MITGNLNVISDARVRNIIPKGPKYIDFPKCRREIAASLNEFSNLWCKRENVEPDALKEWKIDTGISFNSRNTYLLPPKHNLLFLILNEVSMTFILTMFWFQQIKLLTILYSFDDCIILILLSMSLLRPMPLNCNLL